MDLSEDIFAHPVPEAGRRIAWDGVSFCVPGNWELAVFKFPRRNVSRIELEDEYTVRLEAEWLRGRRSLDLATIMQRYEKAAKPLTLKADAHRDVADLPDGWHATHFLFRETASDPAQPDLHIIHHELLTAFYLCPQSNLFCFFMLHRLPEDTEDLVDTIRRLARTFQDHATAPRVPWQLFDIGFTLPREFALESAQFDVGSKLMTFGWRRRRLHLWHFSCPEMFLEADMKPEAWATAFLNRFRGIRGVRFSCSPNGQITSRRRAPYLVGHRTEIARWCFRYDVECRLVDADRHLVLKVFHYRSETDLDVLDAGSHDHATKE